MIALDRGYCAIEMWFKKIKRPVGNKSQQIQWLKVKIHIHTWLQQSKKNVVL